MVPRVNTQFSYIYISLLCSSQHPLPLVLPGKHYIMSLKAHYITLCSVGHYITLHYVFKCLRQWFFSFLCDIFNSMSSHQMTRAKTYQKYQSTKFLIFLPRLHFLISTLCISYSAKCLKCLPITRPIQSVFMLSFLAKLSSICSRLSEINSFPRSWSFKSQTVVIVS